jgi:enamine deaminase RidA (YjgF/YER057c/UK114 family)
MSPEVFVPKKAVTVASCTPPMFGCHATSANGYAFVAVSASSDTGNADYKSQFLRGAIEAQTEAVLEVAECSLTQFGSSLVKGVKIDQFITRPEAAAPYLAVRARRIATETRPSSTHVQVADLPYSESLIAVQLIAHTTNEEKEPIVVPDMSASPGKPFKPAPHALIHGDFVFVTGQVAYDLDKGYLADTETSDATWYQTKVSDETKYALAKIDRIMKHLGGCLRDTVKLEIYLKSLEDVVDVEGILSEAYGWELPARSYIAIVRLAPRECSVEITAICRRPGCKEDIVGINGHGKWADQWLRPAGVIFGGFLFTSTLCGHLNSGLTPAPTRREEVELLFERALNLHPDRPSGLDSMLFSTMQEAIYKDAHSLQALVARLSGHESVAFSIYGMQRPLLWTRASVQADFVLAL